MVGLYFEITWHDKTRKTTKLQHFWIYTVAQCVMPHSNRFSKNLSAWRIETKQGMKKTDNTFVASTNLPFDIYFLFYLHLWVIAALLLRNTPFKDTLNDIAIYLCPPTLMTWRIWNLNVHRQEIFSCFDRLTDELGNLEYKFRI